MSNPFDSGDSQSGLATSHLSNRYNTEHGSVLDDHDIIPSQMDSGIMRCALDLSQAWRMARAYAACRVSSRALPPWNQQSDYSCVMQMHLEFDCRVPLQYRFAANNKFMDLDQESIEQQRHYWGPWLYVQIVYSVIPCILNHPFLLSMRLRNFRHIIPQSFIHQSFEYLNRHTGWIMYFISLLEKKDFYFADLSIAHCIAVVATIHLQHSFVQDQAFRDKSQQGYEKCMAFLRRLGGTWPSVSMMVRASSANIYRKEQNANIFLVW